MAVRFFSIVARRAAASHSRHVFLRPPPFVSVNCSIGSSRPQTLHTFVSIVADVFDEQLARGEAVLFGHDVAVAGAGVVYRVFFVADVADFKAYGLAVADSPGLIAEAEIRFDFHKSIVFLIFDILHG